MADRRAAAPTRRRSPEAVTAYLACDVAETTRTFKTGPRTFDTREAVLAMGVTGVDDEGCAILRMVVRHPHRPYAPTTS